MTTALYTDQDGKVMRSDLSEPVRRLIREKEKYLERRCGKIWTATNPKGERFIFARYNRGRKDHIIVTLASYHKGVGWIPSNLIN